MRYDDNSRNLPASHNRIQWTVAARAIDVSPAETCAMQENDHRGALHREIVILGGVNPEIITSLDDAAMRLQKVVLRRGCQPYYYQCKESDASFHDCKITVI